MSFNSKLKAIFSTVKSIFDEMHQVESDKGMLYYEGELEVGTAIFTESGPAPTGEYAITDYVLSIADGVVSAITAVEAPAPAPQESADAAQFGSIVTDNATLIWDGEGDLQSGYEVYVEDADGNKVAASDGAYTTEDGKVINVVEGKVADIVDPVAEVADNRSADDPTVAEIPVEMSCQSREKFEEVDRILDEIKNSIEEVNNRITAIDARVSDIEKSPADATPHDEYKKIIADCTNGIEAIRKMKQASRIK